MENSGAKVVIVSGGAKGADTLGEEFAKRNNIETKIFKAEWEKYGKSAGFKRNVVMHEFIASKPHRSVLAFWDGESAGTAHNFELSKKYGNEMKTYLYKEKIFMTEENK